MPYVWVKVIWSKSIVRTQKHTDSCTEPTALIVLYCIVCSF